MLKKLRKRFAQKGQGVVEYALILGFVAVVTVGLFGPDSLKSTFTNTLKGIMGQFTKYNGDYEETPADNNNNPVIETGEPDEEPG